MKITSYILALAATLTLLVLSCTQGYGPANRWGVNRNSTATAWDNVDSKKPIDPVSLRRLESVTWDSVKHQLTWDVSRGEKKGDAYQLQSKDRYQINMDMATMTVNGESRRFNEDEAANVRKLMDFISRYALESTVWWEDGEGEPVDDKGTPTRPRDPAGPGMEGDKARAIRIAAFTYEIQ